MFHIDVIESEVLQLHRRKLKDKLCLPRFFLVLYLVDLTQDERLHFDRVKTKPFRKFEVAFERNDSSFEEISFCKSMIDLRGSNAKRLAREQVLNNQTFFTKRMAF